MAFLKLNTTYIKILETVYLLNKKSYYPLVDGLKKILHGDIDEDTSQFKDLITFQTLISLKGRRLNSYIHQLVRYGYLGYKHHSKYDLLYLYITFKGETNLEDYKKKHKINYKKKEKTKSIPTIVFMK